jgi:hypothetical protein
LLHAIHSHLHQRILLPPPWLLGEKISTPTAESRNALKGGKPYDPHGFTDLSKKSINEENSSLSMNIIVKKVETSSLRNLKNMPRNLNEIVLL